MSREQTNPWIGSSCSWRRSRLMDLWSADAFSRLLTSHLLTLGLLLLGSVECRLQLYPEDEFNFSGVTLLPPGIGINVCRNSVVGGSAVCCPGYAREDEFQRHCLLNANEVTKQSVSLTHDPCVVDGKLAGGYCDSDARSSCHSIIVEGEKGTQCYCKDNYNETVKDGKKFCRPCADGTYGRLCGNIVSCGTNNTCNGRGLCDYLNGLCNCAFGWSGGSCNEACNIADNPTSTTVEAEHCKTGRCNMCHRHLTCMYNIPGVKGTSCLCPHGFEARPGRLNTNDEMTDHFYCDKECSGMRYGHNCMHTCDCANESTCDNAVGCVCKAGFMGLQCDKPCPKNYFGPGCNQKCDACYDGCNPATGVCNPCSDGRHGNGTHCRPCSCTPKRNEACVPTQFECGCLSGHERLNGTCRRCREGHFGDGCRQACGCQNGGLCHHLYGSCECKAGWYGNKCQFKCRKGKYGKGCEETCSSDCPLALNDCHHVDGKCVCPEGFYGDTCERRCLLQWSYILDPTNATCVECLCNKANALSCDESSGECACRPGWSNSSSCHEPCSAGYYGMDCQSQCQCKHGDCNHVNGTCTCHPGYHGLKWVVHELSSMQVSLCRSSERPHH